MFDDDAVALVLDPQQNKNFKKNRAQKSVVKRSKLKTHLCQVNLQHSCKLTGASYKRRKHKGADAQYRQDTKEKTIKLAFSIAHYPCLMSIVEQLTLAMPVSLLLCSPRSVVTQE